MTEITGKSTDFTCAEDEHRRYHALKLAIPVVTSRVYWKWADLFDTADLFADYLQGKE